MLKNVPNPVILRSASWYEDKDREYRFPETWQLELYGPVDAPAIDDKTIEKAFANPIGTSPLGDLAKGKKNVVLLADDLTRPTPTYKLMPFILAELKKGGIDEEAIKIAITAGAHRPLEKWEMELKFGSDVVDSLEIVNHDAFDEDLVDCGKSQQGTPIHLNRVVAEADWRICVGGIYPHGLADGFGGGAKMVVPGAVGIESIKHNHQQAPKKRTDMEDIAAIVGIDTIVNVVITSKREIAGVFVGDIIEAHRAGVEMAKRVYPTTLPDGDIDIVITNPYPIDSDLAQVFGKANWPGRFGKKVRVLIANCHDGHGYHGLRDGMSYADFMAQKADPAEIENRKKIRRDNAEKVLQEFPNYESIIFSESPGLKADEFYSYYDSAIHFDSWDSIIAELYKLYPEAKVAIFPCSPIQLH